jgi:hypothetical protein
MKLRLITVLSLVVSLCSATPVYYLATNQTGGQTQIDVNHTSSWLLEPNVDFSIAGGLLTMKAGQNASATVTLSLYEGTDASGSLLSSAALTNAVFCGQVANCGSFAKHTFSFTNPILLDSNLSYFARLTSNAPDVQSKAYFIKSGSFISNANGNAIIPQPIGDVATPEPATIGLLALGLGLVAIPQVRRKLVQRAALAKATGSLVDGTK